MNKKYFNLGICGIIISILIALVVTSIGSKLVTEAYAFGMVSGIFLMCGLALFSESELRKKTEGLEDTMKIER